jgi:RNA polymerase sigma factor (sigma-70 family)
MAESLSSTSHLHGCLERIQSGDRAARDELLGHVYERLRRLARKMLKGFPGVGRWEQTDDVLQNALVRLLRALEDVRPASLREFFALTTEQLRRELLDLARRYFGPQGMGAHHASQAGGKDGEHPGYERVDLSHEPSALADWTELHEQVGELPDDEREVVGLLFYQGLTQPESAAILSVTVRTVQRRWQAALLKLHRVFRGQWPGEKP